MMEQNDYGFILDQSNNKPPKPVTKRARVLIVVVGGLLLALAIIVVATLLFGNQKSAQEKLYPVAAAQADIIEIAEFGQQKISDTASKRQAATIALVFGSQTNKLLPYLGKDAAKKYVLYQNSDYKKLFEDASTSGSLEAKYKTVIEDRLDEYKQILVTAYSQTTSPAVKKQLEAFNTQLSLMRGEQTTPAQEDSSTQP